MAKTKITASVENETVTTDMVPFVQAEGKDLYAKAKRISAPPLLKVQLVPVGASVEGEVVGLTEIQSKNKEIKGKLLWLRAGNGREFLFPLTGVIRKSLEAYGKDDELEEAIKGKIFAFRRLPDGQSQTFKKAMFMFEVFELDKFTNA